MRDALVLMLRVHGWGAYVLGIGSGLASIFRYSKHSELTPILTGIGLLCLAAAYLLKDGEPS